MHSLAHAELTVCLAYLFYNFKISRPANFKEPIANDHFTAVFYKQDVMMNFEPLS